ncbi:hypothetical protein RR11_2120 [Ruegeria sp. R11]|nr:hypothetical protein RR11_2120 [Ruegeria sp. R11]
MRQKAVGHFGQPSESLPFNTARFGAAFGRPLFVFAISNISTVAP